MAYNEYLAERITRLLNEKKVAFNARKMMGGLVFMVDEKMCVGVTKDLLMARVGEENQVELLQREGCQPMNFTGRPMKGFVFVTAEGWDLDEELEHYVDLCLAHNPFAKKSKKKK